MPQFERRLYEPTGDGGVFDPGEDELDDEGSRLPLLIVIALVVLASFAGVVWLAYTQGVQRGREDAPRIVAAPQTDRVASQPTAGNPYSNLKIYQPPGADEDEDSAPEPPTSVGPKATTVPAPPPASTEKPSVIAATPKVTTAPSAKPAGKTAAVHAPAATAPALKPTVTAQNTAAPLVRPKTPTRVAAPAALGSSRPATAAPRNITPPPAIVAKAPPKVAPKSAPIVTPKHAPAIVNPSPKQQAAATKTQTAALPTPISKPAQTAALPPATAPSETAASQTKSTTAGGYVLQIGSYKSEVEANASWQAYKGAHPAAAGFAPNVRRAELGTKGTWYRLRLGPFASLSEANAACAKLKASGGSCFPAKQ